MGREIKYYAIYGLFLFAMLEALLYAAIHWWPAFAENMGAMKALAAPLPILKDQINLVDKLGAPAYVAGQHYFKACNILGSTAAILFASNAIAGEVHRGTFEVWLARPVSRLRLFTERFLLGYAAIGVAVLLSSLTTPALLQTVGTTMAYSDLVRCSLFQTLFLGAMYSVTYVFSAVSSQPLKIAFVMLFFAITEFAIYMVKTITHFSIFRWSDIETYATIIGRNELDLQRVGVLLLIQALAFGIGLQRFLRRSP
ncbi:MAG: ABC transporter permease [Planctomycetes bacterium]|nr:ABC transporter permease [Planctomycetota bacterium]MCB9910116.1 ABC transporter permease [Planctomycetota bacterium]MCB9913117.1 ABC transporter permease [Planctomycetota bacterium]HPF14199.1 ABC transporter permease [Planctomycetota bacterium]HRV82183.1 ABC transporter permease [Planctomycetota bacterium]